jgi:hypothetical protein
LKHSLRVGPVYINIVGRDNIGRVNRGKVVGDIAKRRGEGGTTPVQNGKDI